MEKKEAGGFTAGLFAFRILKARNRDGQDKGDKLTIAPFDRLRVNCLYTPFDKLRANGWFRSA